eukprot:4539515-Pleurochrysis_carterae.AAC.4
MTNPRLRRTSVPSRATTRGTSAKCVSSSPIDNHAARREAERIHWPQVVTQNYCAKSAFGASPQIKRSQEITAEQVQLFKTYLQICRQRLWDMRSQIQEDHSCTCDVMFCPVETFKCIFCDSLQVLSVFEINGLAPMCSFANGSAEFAVKVFSLVATFLVARALTITAHE